MRRNIVLPIVGGVVAALILVGALLLAGRNNNKKTDLTISTPIPSATVAESATPSPSASPTGSPGASASPTSSAAAKTAAPAASAAPTPASTPYRAATSVNCASTSDAKFCSRQDGMVVANDKATKSPENKGAFTPPGGPTYTMTSTVTKKGDGLNLHVEVLIENKTGKTFVFPKREVVLAIRRDGKSYKTLKTTGAGFEMTPGGKMTARFDQPISTDGTYTWQTKTWFFEK